MFAVMPAALAVGCGSSAGPSGLGQLVTATPTPQATVTIPPEPTFTDPGVSAQPPVTPPPVTVPPPPPVTVPPMPPPVESAYDMALDQFAAHCTQSRAQVAAMIPRVLADLQENGVEDETLLSVTQHLTTAASGVSGRTDCVGVAAAYAVLREPQ